MRAATSSEDHRSHWKRSHLSDLETTSTLVERVFPHNPRRGKNHAVGAAPATPTAWRPWLAPRGDDRLASALVDVDLPGIVVALAAGVGGLHVLRHRLSPSVGVVRGGHVGGLGVVEGDAAAADRARHRPRLVWLASEQVALHALDRPVVEDALTMAADR